MVLGGWLSNSAPPLLVRAVRAYKRLEQECVTEPRVRSASPGRAVQLSTNQIGQILARYAAGASARDLAAEFGVHRHTITKHLRDHGVQTVNRFSEADSQTAIDLYAQGWSLARIGERLGRDHTVIRNALERARVQRRDTHGRVRSS